MVYELYNEKEASGVDNKSIIGQIARELGLSRIVTEGCYNFEKTRLDPEVNYTVILRNIFTFKYF